MVRTLACLVTLAAVLGGPAPASACGGCFHLPNPTGTPSEVDGHRMVVAISPEGTTLWDQIRYTGNPRDFAWVLPVNGTPSVELADEGFFEALTQVTTITMIGPTPPRTTCADPCAPWAAPIGFASAGEIDRMERGGVTVLHQSVIGPYETATIGSEDPSALLGWLEDNGYAVDPGLLPTIAYYTEQRMNFVALRLAPQEGIDRMQPVRITSPGLSLAFPLRMVAAGVTLDVDLELFVFAEGRMEAANYGNAEVARDEIVYDWAANSFSYDALFDDALFAGSGTGTNWVTEFAQPAPMGELGAYVSYPPDGGEPHRAEGDVALVADTVGAAPYLTRLRTRLPPRELDRDLVLRAAAGADLGTQILVTREVNRAAEPDCPSLCAMPTGLEPGPGSRGSATSLRCAAAPGQRSMPVAVLGLVLLALGRRGRR
jgi:hypothetical protein